MQYECKLFQTHPCHSSNVFYDISGFLIQGFELGGCSSISFQGFSSDPFVFLKLLFGPFITLVVPLLFNKKGGRDFQLSKSVEKKHQAV
jgi:hypothetical protein